jgi:hypothetical protein
MSSYKKLNWKGALKKMSSYPNQPYQPVDPTPYRDLAVEKVVASEQVGDTYVENVRETYLDANGNLVQRQEEYIEDEYQARLNLINRVDSVIYFLVAALETLLALRFVFRAFGADPNNGIVNLIYTLSNPFVVAFNGIFSDQAMGRGSVLEISTLLAMVMYALLTWGLVSLIGVIFEPSRSSKHSSVTSRRRRF